MSDNPLRDKLSKEMFEHLKAYLPKEFQAKLASEQLIKEVLYCLSSFVLIEKRRALIQFTNRVASAKNNDKPSDDFFSYDEEKAAQTIDELNELG